MGRNTRAKRPTQTAPTPRDKAAPYVSASSVTEPVPQTKRNDHSRNIEDVLNFYDRTLIPKQKVCPFSNPSRRNPCTTHASPKTRKDIIQHHLLYVKQTGYDDQHPEDDPLWESWEVSKYWLLSRPPPLASDEDKKAARSKAARKSYRSRLEREEREADIRKRLYEEGKIPFSEYKSVLVGHKRRKAEDEYHLKEERKRLANLGKKILELAAKQTSTTPMTTADQQKFDDLTTSLQNVKESNDRMDLIRDEIIGMCTEVVRCWGQSEKFNMLISDDSFMTGMVFPSECSIVSFYQYASLLLSPAHWNDQPFRGTYVRNMKKALQVYAQDSQSEIMPEDEDGTEAEAQLQQIDDSVALFNACCDAIEADERKAIEEGRIQEWLDMQDKLWTEAKVQRQRWVDLMMGWRSPIQTARILNNFRKVIGALTRETETDAQISLAA
jgi:hypothetical protein